MTASTTTPATSATSPASPAIGHTAWHEQRLAALTAPQGNLALIETRWLEPGQRLTAAEALAGQPRTVTATTLERRNLETGEPEYGIRLWDAASAAITAFDTVSLFDYDPAWVIEASFSPVSGDRTIPFEHIRDNGGSRELVVPGDIAFTVGGTDYTMSAFDDGGTLLLVFGDPTNGEAGPDETYGSGRFLFVQRSDGGGFGTAGTVTLDFNRAFVPPCGFSVQYNCPLPPPQNRFAGPVRAGERLAVFSNGFDIYTV